MEEDERSELNVLIPPTDATVPSLSGDSPDTPDSETSSTEDTKSSPEYYLPLTHLKKTDLSDQKHATLQARQNLCNIFNIHSNKDAIAVLDKLDQQINEHLKAAQPNSPIPLGTTRS